MTDLTNAPKLMKWAGGEHAFNLNHPWVRNVLSIRGLPGDNGSTPSACLQRFNHGIYSSGDIERVIYLGLVGGGMPLNDADDLVRRFVRTRPMLESGPLAIVILEALFAEATDVDTEAA